MAGSAAAMVAGRPRLSDGTGWSEGAERGRVDRKSVRPSGGATVMNVEKWTFQLITGAGWKRLPEEIIADCADASAQGTPLLALPFAEGK